MSYSPMVLLQLDSFLPPSNMLHIGMTSQYIKWEGYWLYACLFEWQGTEYRGFLQEFSASHPWLRKVSRLGVLQFKNTHPPYGGLQKLAYY